MTLRTALSALLVGVAGCESVPEPAGVVVRDSAGVRIVENGAPRWSGAESIRVAREPLLSLGSVDGPAQISFSRVVGAYRLPTGGLAVFDGTAGELRFFDAGGRHLRSVGRIGDGPGEFQRVGSAGIAGDSIWLYDVAARRLTFVDGPSGGFRIVPVEADNLRLGAAGVLADGSLVLAADLGPAFVVEARPPAGMHRWRAGYLRIGRQGRTLDTILRAPGAERLLQYGERTIELLRPLYARSVSHATRGDELVYGDQETYELDVYGTDGSLRQSIRRTDVGLALGEDAFRAAVEDRVGDAPEPARPGLRRLFESQPVPSTRPAYGSLLVDAARRLWVQDWALDGDARGWAVFGEGGVWLGIVELPPRFRPTHILSEEVVGVWRDELDVEHVRVYALEEPTR